MTIKSPVFAALQRSHFGEDILDPQIDYFQVQSRVTRGGRERNGLKKMGNMKRWWNRSVVLFWKIRRWFESRTSLSSSYDIRRMRLGDVPSAIRARPAPIYGSADGFCRRRSLPARMGRAAEDGEFNIPYLSLKEFNTEPCRFSKPNAPIYLVT